MAKSGRIAQHIHRIRTYLCEDVWKFTEQHAESKLKLALRIILISWEGIKENLLFSRAAALSYSSLIGLGPVLAIIIIISGSMIKADPETQLKEALLFIAPSLNEYVSIQSTNGQPSQLDQMISQIVSGSKSMMDNVNTSGSTLFGGLGIMVLVWVGIQLLTTIEKTMNEIWGIKKGRPWNQRIVYYWTFLTLGALLGLGSTALFSASNIVNMLDFLPQGKVFAQILLTISPFVSFIMLISLLSLFYMFFPNTSVKFKAALYGSILTAILLIGNNFVSLVYVQKVITFGSLYGSLGIIPVLMFGMYFFWVFILLGGVLTYAIQNSRILTNENAWKGISPITQQTLSFAVFITIARQFESGSEPLDIEAISQKLKVPTDALNESIERLIEMDWIHVAQTEDKILNENKTTFLPSHPLEQLHLCQFRQDFDHLGNSISLDHLTDTDPLIPQFISTQNMIIPTQNPSIQDLLRS